MYRHLETLLAGFNKFMSSRLRSRFRSMIGCELVRHCPCTTRPLSVDIRRRCQIRVFAHAGLYKFGMSNLAKSSLYSHAPQWGYAVRKRLRIESPDLLLPSDRPSSGLPRSQLKLPHA